MYNIIKALFSIMVSIRTEFICIVLVIHLAGSANIPRSSPNNEVAAPVGGTAVLPCNLQTFKNSKNLEAVLWKKMDKVEEIVVYVKNANDQLMNQSKAYTGRTTMSEQWLAHGEATLTVKEITQDDAGEYSCWMKESSAGPLSEHKCCSMKLYVEQRKSGEQQQLLIAWTLYLLFLILCIYASHRCGSQKTQRK